MLGAYLAVSAINLGSVQANQSERIDNKPQYGKVYEGEVDASRGAIYERNRQPMNQFNTERPEAGSFQLKLNHLADFSKSELAKLNELRPKKGADEPPPNTPEEQAFLDAILADTSIEVPDALDWREAPGRVSEVKNQGQCGSCWAFSAVGALEGQEKVRNPRRRSITSLKQSLLGNRNTNATVTPLSEQNLVDCVTGDYGCGGGEIEDALRYIKTAGGIDDEASYPYEELTGECRFDKDKVAFRDNGAARLPIGDEQQLKAVVAKFGPVAVAIDADSDSFLDYEDGVYIDDNCGNEYDDLGHAVLVVGYGTDPKEGDYWIVKNSWGMEWGYDGYIKMARNRKNMCGIATEGVIPTF